MTSNFKIPVFLLDWIQTNISGRISVREKQAVEKTTTPEIRKTITWSGVTYEGTYQGRPIRVRIIGQPIHEPGSE
jgi:hypothetical protein